MRLTIVEYLIIHTVRSRKHTMVLYGPDVARSTDHGTTVPLYQSDTDSLRWGLVAHLLGEHKVN